MTTYPRQVLTPNSRIQWCDPKTGMLTTPALQFIQQIWNFVVNTNQVLPCTATNVGNVYSLSTFPLPPSASSFPEYVDYGIFSFVAPATSTGTVTAGIDDNTIIPVFKNNGATVAGSGDVVNHSLYLLIYNSNLNSGGGGFVLK